MRAISRLSLCLSTVRCRLIIFVRTLFCRLICRSLVNALIDRRFARYPPSPPRGIIVGSRYAHAETADLHFLDFNNHFGGGSWARFLRLMGRATGATGLTILVAVVALFFVLAERALSRLLKREFFRLRRSLRFRGIHARFWANSTLLFLIRKLCIGLKSSKTGSWTGTTSTKLIFQSNVW